GISTEVISAYDVHMRVQDQGWTDETKSEAGWVAFGMATDLATLGGTRFISAAVAAESAQRAALAYQLTQVGWSAMGADAALGDNCFVSGTQVWTEQGMRPIEEIKEGDQVWSWDERSGETTLQPVLQAFKNTTRDIILLHIGTETIATTPEHPMWVEDQGWVLAGELKNGDYVRTYSGMEPVTVERQETVIDIPTYNIDVAGGDTFYVSNMFMLTHNSSFRKIFKLPQLSKAATNANIREAIDAGVKAGLIELRHSRKIYTFPGGRRIVGRGPKKYYFKLDVLRRPAQIIDGKLVKSGVDLLEPHHYAAIVGVASGHKHSTLKKQIARVLRNGGGKHEMLPVVMFPHMVKLGVPIGDIHLLTLPTKGLKFKLPGIGVGDHHASRIGKIAHRLLFRRLSRAASRDDAARISAEFHKEFVCGLAGVKC
ncbi:polymorphic toxin-type HINT domain-containing protein, partial [Pseudomonadota bacterium]